MGAAIRGVIKLALVALVVHAGVKILPVFWNYVRFRDACEEIAKYSSRKSVPEIQSRVLTKAGQYDIPVEQADVHVRKQGTTTFIDASYQGQLEYFPAQFYPYDFQVRVQGVPPAFGDFIP